MLPPLAYCPAAHAALLARAWPHSYHLDALRSRARRPITTHLRPHKPEPAIFFFLSRSPSPTPPELGAQNLAAPLPYFPIQLATMSTSPCDQIKLNCTILHHRNSPCTVFFSRANRGVAVSTTPWLGHLGYSSHHVHLILCSLYHPDAHAHAFFSST
jgi:hypothetical protein